MEARIVLGCLAVVSALVVGFCFAYAVWQGHTRGKRQRASSGIPDGEGGLPRLLRNGFIPLLPAATVLLRVRLVAQYAQEAVLALEQKGSLASAQSVLSVTLAVLLAAFLLIAGVTGSFACGIAVSLCALALLAVRLNALREKRRFAVRQAIPDALRAMQVCFQAGFSLLQTFQQIAAETKGPLGDLFRHSAHELQMGATTAQALQCLRGGSSVPELSFVAVALDVQHQAGGSMREVLEAARSMVEEELTLLRKLRVQTAQAKLSARVVTVMPFVLVAVFSLISKDFLSPFFSSFAGMALLGLAAAMQATGVLLVRRLLKVRD